MRTRKTRNKEWINGHLVPRPKTAGYRKFLQATLPDIPKPKYNSIKPKHEE